MSEAAILFRTWQLSHHFDGEPEPRTWELPRPSIGTQASYSRYLSRVKLAGINSNRDLMNDAQYRLAMEIWEDGFIGPDYAWKSKNFYESLNSDENQKELLWLWIGDAEREARRSNPKQPSLPRAKIEELWAARRDELSAFANVDNAGNITSAGLLWEMLSERNPTHPPAAKGEESR